MQKRISYVLLTLAVLPVSLALLSWGTWGHQHINHTAVFALPEGMRSFFYNHIDFITEEAVMPDVRKYTLGDKAEFPRHFIDLENYPVGDSLPLAMKDVTAKYDAKFLEKNGILPWYIAEAMQKLTKAFAEKRKAEILILSADLGHYLGDANMPLHTSVNHNGQLTNQKGIHALFESQLAEQFGEHYNLYTGDAAYIKDVQAETWRIVMESHRLADTLLLAEEKLKAGYDSTQVFAQDAAGKIAKNKYNDPIHTRIYATAYHQALKGMVERQLRAAITATANFWYTAWVNAGKPDLSGLDAPAITNRNQKNLKEDYAGWKNGQLPALKIDTEF